MKATSMSHDPVGFDRWAAYAEVFFQGASITDCVAADEEGRKVLRFQRDAKGHVKVNRATDEAVLAWEYGHVRIEIQDKAPEWAKQEFAAARNPAPMAHAGATATLAGTAASGAGLGTR